MSSAFAPANSSISMAARKQKMVDRCEQEDALGAINEISMFLGDWLTNHINGTDKKYSAYLTSKVVQTYFTV